ncbi:hypothetical protein OG625_01615 [Streptomyces sp. NBC_01351]|uniref:hypothetical protein n=1 Tax=Streptomyces sp. NBC_01351 TaxID=2903833 RepID=UPI002E317288|nr:hypothetical protein [Streptomyces sp. NBC_01351]
MSEPEPRAWGPTAALPAVAAAVVFAWAYWCFTSSSAPSTTVAVAGVAILLCAACTVYFARVGGSGGFFGTLFLALGLLATVATADQTTARGEVATCVVREVQAKDQHAHGEGSATKTLYRLALTCPGGYPAEVKDAPRAAVGAEIRVSYDPERRVTPSVEGETSPRTTALWALILLAACTGLAGRRRPAPATASRRRP